MNKRTNKNPTTKKNRKTALQNQLGENAQAHYLRTLRIDIIREELCVNTWISCKLTFVESLNRIECHLSRESKLTITIYLRT